MYVQYMHYSKLFQSSLYMYFQQCFLFFSHVQLFNLCIENSEPSKDLQVRLETLLKNTTHFVYVNVARWTEHVHVQCVYSNGTTNIVGPSK